MKFSYQIMTIWAVVLQLGCEASHISGAQLHASSNLIGSADGTTYTSDPALAQAAAGILRTSCSGCHGSASGSGGVSQILDVSHLIQSGLIVPGDPNAGRVIGAIAAGTMPPSGALPASSLQTIKDWVASMSAGGGGSTLPPPPPLQATFQSISENILKPKCVTCHRSGAREPEIRYDSYSAAISTGRIRKGVATESEMYRQVARGSMPPASDGYPRLSAEELLVIETWINSGAPNN